MAAGDEDPDAALREAARHRGLRLVKSRRRKPGGDYGRFGLSDAAGAKLLGFGDDGLTATADEVAAYLRRGENATWAESARVTPARPEPAPRPEAPAPDPAAKVSKRKQEPSRRTSEPRQPTPADDVRKSPRPKAKAPPPPPPPPPVLRIREVDKRDVAAIAALIGSIDADADAATIGKRLAAIGRDGLPVLVADLGGIVGCVACAVVPALHREPIGRVTLLVVTERERRKGHGRALIDAAQAALRERGCTDVEVMSDIAIRSAHGFFRKLGFAQASYRFVRPT